MSEGISVGRIVAQVKLPNNPLEKRPPQDVYWGPTGPLTAADKAALEEFWGHEFNWPPGPGEPFPPQASSLAQVRMSQFQDTGKFGDLFGLMMRFQKAHQGIDGSLMFDDEFMSFMAERSQSPVAGAFLAGGGQSPRYA